MPETSIRDEGRSIVLDGAYDWLGEPDIEEFRHARRLFDDKSPDAIPALEKLADAGSPMSAILLGYAYFDGHGVVADKTAAIVWLRRAAASGSSYALHVLARHLQHMNAPADTLAAYEAAVAAGHIQSAKFLAGLKLNGIGCSRNAGEAMAHLERGALHGDPIARSMLGAVMARREWYNPISLVRGVWMMIAGILGAARRMRRIELERYFPTDYGAGTQDGGSRRG